jgi:hypothetical protein
MAALICQRNPDGSIEGSRIRPGNARNFGLASTGVGNSARQRSLAVSIEGSCLASKLLQQYCFKPLLALPLRLKLMLLTTTQPFLPSTLPQRNSTKAAILAAARGSHQATVRGRLVPDVLQ